MTHNWRYLHLKEVCLVSQYGINSSSGSGRTYPILKMNNLQDGHINLDKLTYVQLSDEDFERFELQRNDLLINRTNSPALVGKTALFELDGNYVFASYLVRLRLNSDLLSPQFANLYFNSDLGKRQLQALATKGVSQSNINPTALKNRFTIPVPPLPEQRRIAAILGTWDTAIALTEQLIATKQRLKKGLMQVLLTGKKRFGEFVQSVDIQLTPYGDLPTDWQYIPIKDIAKQVSTKNVQGEDLSVLSCTKRYGLVDSLEYFGRRMFSDDTSTYKVVRRRQFAYATNHIEEGSIGYQNLHDEALISPMYTVFETNDQIDDGFLFKLLKTEKYRHIFEVSTSASINRRGSLRWDAFSQIKIPFPSYAEQRKIASVLQVCDDDLTLLAQKLAALRAQNKGLMQQLLTGKVRVKV